MNTTTNNLKIAVLSLKDRKFETFNYLLNRLVQIWRESGHEIIVLGDTKQYQEADILFLHVDLTVIPEDYLKFSRQFPVVVNRQVHDISKTRVSSHLVRNPLEYDGEVIVKTNLNSAGTSERRFRTRTLSQRLLREARRLVPGMSLDKLRKLNYKVYSSPGDVPSSVWGDPLWVVEKYLPEREGDHYCIRHWVFLGEEEFTLRVHSPNQVVKASNIVHREYDLPVPDDLREIRKALGFDYGKFDYTVIDGETVLFDANRTPALTITETTSPELLSAVNKLSQGLYTLFPQVRGNAS